MCDLLFTNLIMKLKKYLLGLGFTLLAIACVFTVQIGTINAAVLTGSTTVENVTVGEDNLRRSDLPQTHNYNYERVVLKLSRSVFCIG